MSSGDVVGVVAGAATVFASVKSAMLTMSGKWETSIPAAEDGTGA